MVPKQVRTVCSSGWSARSTLLASVLAAAALLASEARAVAGSAAFEEGALAERAAKLARHGKRLEARLLIDRETVAYDSNTTKERAARGARRVLRLRDQTAARLVREADQIRKTDALVERAAELLQLAGVQWQREGGDNTLLSLRFDQQRLHPGAPHHGEAFWVDCDSGVVLLDAILDRVDRLRPRLGLSRQLGALSTSDHLALLVYDRNRKPWVFEAGASSSQWKPLAHYIQFYNDRYAESIAPTTRENALLANAWEIAAAHHLRKRRPEQALFAIRSSTSDGGRLSVGAQNTMAIALRELDRPREALAVLESALRAKAGDARLHCTYSSILLALGEPEKALAAADRALAIEPASTLAARRRAAATRQLAP